jgi:TolB-like protein
MKKLFLLILLVFMLDCHTMPKGPGALRPEEGVDFLIKSFVASKVSQGKNIGVGDFVDIRGEVDPYPPGFANLLEVELSKAAPTNRFTVVGRQNLSQLAEEWKLSLSGAIDSSSAKKVGTLLGIDLLLAGKMSSEEEALTIAAQALDTETGQILWGERVRVAKGKETRFPSSEKEASLVKVGEIKVELWTDKQFYKIGEPMVLHFRANQDCYVTLLDVGTSGSVYFLYPNRFSGGGKVLGGKTYSIPGPKDGFAITVGGPPGIEIVRAIATLMPMPLSLSDFSKEAGAFKKVENPASLTRDLNLVATHTHPSSRGEGVIRIQIRDEQ